MLFCGLSRHLPRRRNRIISSQPTDVTSAGHGGGGPAHRLEAGDDALAGRWFHADARVRRRGGRVPAAVVVDRTPLGRVAELRASVDDRRRRDGRGRGCSAGLHRRRESAVSRASDTVQRRRGKRRQRRLGTLVSPAPVLGLGKPQLRQLASPSQGSICLRDVSIQGRIGALGTTVLGAPADVVTSASINARRQFI